jgi:hypothetical protein
VKKLVKDSHGSTLRPSADRNKHNRSDSASTDATEDSELGAVSPFGSTASTRAVLASAESAALEATLDEQITQSKRGPRMPPKKPTKKQLSDAGKALQNPRTREKNETKAAKTLAAGRKKKK